MCMSHCEDGATRGAAHPFVASSTPAQIGFADFIANSGPGCDSYHSRRHYFTINPSLPGFVLAPQLQVATHSIS